MILLNYKVWAAARTGFEVFTHEEVPANDGGISLGRVTMRTPEYLRVANN